MALKDFTLGGHGWFDKAPTGDSARQQGLLSILGNIGQNVAAPLMGAYGNEGGYKALQLQQQQQQADLEFQKYLTDKKLKTSELGIKKGEADNNNALMAAYLKSQGIDINSLLGNTSGNGQTSSPGQQSPFSPQVPPQMPPGAAMSLANGQYGDVNGKSLSPMMSMGSPSAPSPQQQSMIGQLQPQASSMFANMQPSFTGGKFNLKPTPNSLTPEQSQSMGQQLVDYGNGGSGLAPSQLSGGRMAKMQAIAEARKIDPNYNAAQADVNFSANKVGANGIEKLYNNVKTFHDTFTKNADNALRIADNFDKSKMRLLNGASPFLNKADLGARINIAGDKEASQLLTAIWTASSEYARLVSAPGATGSQITDSARGEAQALLHAYMNNGTLHGQLDPKEGIMRQDADNRLGALSERRNEIKGIKSESKSPTAKLNKDNLFEGL